jgi:gluconolactonase
MVPAMSITLLALAFAMQNAPTASPATATPVPPTKDGAIGGDATKPAGAPAVSPAVPPAVPPAAPPAPLAAKWPQKVSEAGEDIPGVVKAGTPILKWSEGHNFTEGPACAADGTVWFVDIPANEILRVDPNGAVVLTRQANATFGLCVGKDGALFGAQANPGAITSIDPKSGAITVLCDKRAAEVEGTGRSLGRLNDLVLDDAGGAWFTAPVLGRRRAGMPPDAVYYAPIAGGDAIEVVRDDKVRGPNGIGLSPDGKTLYVVPYLSMEIMAYPVEGPGKVGAGRVFYEVPGGTRESIGGDGCTVDAKGNLYVAIPPRAAIFVLSPEGKPLGQIRFPERVSNCALGGKDGRTLYVTATAGVYAIDVENPRAR